MTNQRTFSQPVLGNRTGIATATPAVDFTKMCVDECVLCGSVGV